MYPTISDLIKDITGLNIPLPIQSYGFMLGIALVAGYLIYRSEYKRKEKEKILIPFFIDEKIGEPASVKNLITTFIIMFFVGYKGIEAIINYSEFVKNPHELILSWRGNITGGIIIAILSTIHTWWKKNKNKLNPPKTIRKKVFPHEITGNMMLFVGIMGIIGAKLFDIIQPDNFKMFLQHPLKELFSFSGLTFYGGMITGFISGIYYIRKYNINILHSIDAFAPAISLGYAIGRIGCQVSGDGCWGIINNAQKPEWLSIMPNWIWSYDYPNNVLGITLEAPVFPTPLYETIIMTIVFTILWTLRKHIKIPGFIFSLYLIFAGIERFFIEYLRVNETYKIGLTQAQIISIIMIAGGSGIIIYMLKNKQKFINWGKTTPKPINYDKTTPQKNKK